jgi:hypothetical protein
MENKAKIILRRTFDFRGSFGTFKVYIDGVKQAAIRNGEILEFSLAPGKHVIVCKVFLGSSEEYHVDLKENEIAYLRIRNGMKLVWILFAAFTLAYLAQRFAYPNNTAPNNLTYVVWGLAGLLLLAGLYYSFIARKKSLELDKDPKALFAS